MRRGKIAYWDDAKGFGFILPEDDSERVFVHVSAFGGDRPEQGDAVEYLTRFDGRARIQAFTARITARSAKPVEKGRRRDTPQRPAESRPTHGRNKPDRAGEDSFAPKPFKGPAFALLFFVVLFGATLARFTEPALAALYIAASLVTFLFYANDKHAAKTGGWRTKERTLHLLELFGGWPGALFAQRLLHHKSRKTSYQVEFWIVTALNLGFYAWTFTEQGAIIAHQVFGSASAAMLGWLHLG
ncbi:MAG TPA: cold shock and DUF1294 domain-containing protein [Opitutales bacterium]|nr:cold shock and DUF1294 domain-containing protein [Opitutales bacterium]